MSEIKELTSKTYKTLDYFEHIRQYPGMYIGSKDSRGLLHCVKEIVSNSVDEWLNGAGDTITVKIQKDGGILVTDNARGIPYEEHEKGISILRACFGTPQTGGKFINGTEDSGYNSSGGEHGTGTKAVNALSTKLVATSYCNGIAETVEFSKGKFVNTNSEPSDKHGLSVLFYPDYDIFENAKLDLDALETLLREFSFLCSGLIYRFEIEGKKEITFVSSNGLKDYLEYLAKGKKQITAPIYLNSKEDKYQIEAIVGYTSSYTGITKLYTNNIPQEKGTHLTGFKTAWTSTLNQWARDKGILKDKDENLTGSDFEEGQILILNFKMIDPVFKGQNKEELSSSEGRTYVQKMISEEAKIYFNNHEKDIRTILDKAIKARKAREAAQAARDASRRNKDAKKKKVINPDKLKEAELLGEDSTLLCVEGLSAGASMTNSRDAKHYGVLMLRGKPLNLFTNSEDKAAKNEEIQLLINALGITPGAYKASDLRYGRVAICSDSDSDGYHIGLLLAVALQKLCPEFIQEGRLCWLRSPLWIVKHGKTEEYYYTDDEVNVVRNSKKGALFQRNKGLGSLSPAQARNSMFSPEYQRMDVLTPTDEAITLLQDLMGKDNKKRKDYIFENVDFSEVME